MLYLIRAVLLIIWCLAYNVEAQELTSPSVQEGCDLFQIKSELKIGWQESEPYQYVATNSYGSSLTGIDIELIRYLAIKLGISIAFEKMKWVDQLENIKSGRNDIASGSTKVNERESYAYFSIPYRFEENSLFVMRDSDKKIVFKNIKDYLIHVRLQNCRLGVINGFRYADPIINEFVKDAANADIISLYSNTVELINALLNREIDSFLADRVVSATLIMKGNTGNLIEEISLNISTPISLMLSKRTISNELLEQVNSEISVFRESEKYKQIVRDYLYPILLLQTVNADWFHYVSLLGVIAFAISGIALTIKEGTSLFNGFIIALIPAISIGAIRDFILRNEKINLLLTPSYIYTVMITLLLCFITVRLLDFFTDQTTTQQMIGKYWYHIFIFCDAIGQAAFIVIGVILAIVARVSPIELWGPFFAFIISSFGITVRDLLTKNKIIICFDGQINPEISVLWGFIFALFLQFQANNPSIEKINLGVAMTIIGCFMTRISVLYFKIPNIKFQSN